MFIIQMSCAGVPNIEAIDIDLAVLEVLMIQRASLSGPRGCPDFQMLSGVPIWFLNLVVQLVVDFQPQHTGMRLYAVYF